MHWLLWSLAGADLLGTPGFKDLNQHQTPQDIFGGWFDDVGSHTPQGLYYIYPASEADPYKRGRPAHTRFGPYVDLTKVNAKRGGYFTDAFKQPILYYRANLGAPLMADYGSHLGGKIIKDHRRYDEDPSGRIYVPSGVYNLRDNCCVTGDLLDDCYIEGRDLGAGTNHFNNDSHDALKILGDPTQPAAQSPRGSFFRHIGDPAITAAPRPRNPESYLLLTAGPDALFGISDDIANVPVGG